MKAITICQPYASLIANPPHFRRIENRTWSTNYRGPIAIHAGKSRQWLDSWDRKRMPDPMPFGAIVAVANLVACLNRDEWIEDPRPVPGIAGEEMTSLMLGEFAEGPWCWVLSNIRPLQDPVPCAGKQGIWECDCVSGFRFMQVRK